MLREKIPNETENTKTIVFTLLRIIMFRKPFLFLVVCLCFLIVSMTYAQAPTKVYWTEAYPTGSYPIQRANLDGSSPEELLSSTFIKGIAIDFHNSKMYWADEDDGKIERANLDGSGREDVLTGVSPEDVALDLVHGKIYWTNYTYSNAVIMRANLDGTEDEVLTGHLGDGCVLEAIAVDVPGGKVYWVERFDREIRRANLDGSSNERLLRCSDGVVNPFGIAVGGGKMYWSDASYDEIYRANLDGSSNEALVTGLNDPRYLALDTTNGKIYWASDGNNSIRRANLDGTGLEDLVTTGLSHPWGIALDYNEASLPVKLSYFNAIASADGVTLHWHTETEVGNVGFAIYRSEARNEHYTKIGWLDGAGNPAMPTDYQFLDEKIEAGKTYFYYVEDIDIEGKRNKSEVIQIKVHIKPELQDVIPEKFALLQNYPNPFNPETWMPYLLAKDAHVTITIYNINGQAVRTLNLGNQDAGEYTIKERAAYWDGRDNFGEKVAGGIYFYTLQAGKFTATRRMLIVK